MILRSSIRWAKVDAHFLVGRLRHGAKLRVFRSLRDEYFIREHCVTTPLIALTRHA